jgi:predicted AAA+ superfamily ATPase
MMRKVSESLAGRAVYLTLWPMTEAEKRGRAETGPWGAWLDSPDAAAVMRRATPAGPSGDWASGARAGGLPVPALDLEEGGRAQWFDGYVRTYLERDLQDVAAISSLADFRRLMRLAALRVGQMLNQSELARDAALAQATAHRYLNLLETSYQVVRLPAFATSRTKRLVKTPKLYWTDTGLAAHLSGTGDVRPLPGALLENLVLMQILAWTETVVPRPEVHYWRTHGGLEVDFVVEHRRRLLPIEVKSAGRPRPADAKGIAAFLDDHPRSAPFGILLHGGREAALLAEKVAAVPVERLWG